MSENNPPLLSSKPQYSSPSKSVLYYTFALILFLLVLLLLGVAWFPIWCFRRLVILASKLFVSGIGEPLSVRDVHLLENYNARHALSMVLTLSLKGDISAQRLRELFLQNVLQSKLEEGDSTQQLRFHKLTQSQTSFLGFRFWRDDPNFAVENHIHQVFHDGDDTPDYFKSFEGLAGEFTGRPYPPQRSPWEIWIVRNVPDEEEEEEEDGAFKKTVVMIRAHHSLMDGYSSLNVLHHLCGKPAVVVPSAYLLQQMSILSITSLSVKGLLDRLRQRSVEVQRQRQFKQALLDVKIKRGEVVFRDKVHFGYSPLLPLAQVKAVAAKFGVRVPAVLSVLLAEGLSDVFQNQLGDVRTPYAIPLPGRVGAVVNHSHVSSLLLPTCKRVPMATKLVAINKSYLELASNPFIVVLEIVGNILGKCPAGLPRLVIKNLHYSPIAITNFSMGRESFQLGGLDVADFRAAIGVLEHSSGSQSVIFGYKDHVRILLAGHDSLYSEADVNRIVGGALENLEKLMSMDVVDV